MLFAIFLAGCTNTAQAPIVRVSASVPVGSNNVLNLRLAEVSLPQMDIRDALSVIFHSNLGLSNSGKPLIFDYFTSFSRTSGPDRFRSKHGNITYQGKDVRLKEVLDSICKQAGWSYRPVDGRVEFIDDLRYMQSN